jgi:hypothetical protein
MEELPSRARPTFWRADVTTRPKPRTAASAAPLRPCCRLPRRQPRQPARPGAMVDRAESSADGARRGQPFLANALRARHRRHPENFGVQGAPPSHPELLDWLARDFVNSNWDVKALLKKIVLSATYRQDSKGSVPTCARRTPKTSCWRAAPRNGCPAEMVRDTALAASGLLDDALGGPPVSPYSPGDLWRESNTMSPAYQQSVGTALYRRSLYTVWKRTAPMPDMTSSTRRRAKFALSSAVRPPPRNRLLCCSTTRSSSKPRACWPKKPCNEGGPNDRPDTLRLLAPDRASAGTEGTQSAGRTLAGAKGNFRQGTRPRAPS